jgi:hypothetical protein
MVGMWVLKSDQGFKIFSEPAFRKSWERVGTVGGALLDAMSKKPTDTYVLTNEMTEA